MFTQISKYKFGCQILDQWLRSKSGVPFEEERSRARRDFFIRMYGSAKRNYGVTKSSQRAIRPVPASLSVVGSKTKRKNKLAAIARTEHKPKVEKEKPKMNLKIGVE